MLVVSTCDLHPFKNPLPLSSKFIAINTAIAKEKIGAIPGFFVGGVAACGAVTFTNPWEVVKTRLQLQGELARGNSNYIKPYTNVFQAFSMIVRREGLRGIQKGIGPAYVYQLVMNGSRLGFYDPIRNSLIGFLNVSNTSMPISILSGGLAGVIGAALGSPFYLVKTRMQSHSQHIMAVGHQHSYKNTFDALKQISKKGGIKDLFRGVDAAMLRTGVGSATQLSSYFYIKRWTIQETGLTDSDILVHVFSSLLSGLCVCTAMNPFDVISTRMYNQKVEKIVAIAAPIAAVEELSSMTSSLPSFKILSSVLITTPATFYFHTILSVLTMIQQL
ncbi:5346_t:CDS:2 [Entrophospora sp. SA101]|nr:5346_t:CDS:2 [Entrophospora sp. SA101]